MKQAVIFDLDGVITDTARYHYLAWKRLAESQGVHFDEAFNEHLKGIDRMGSLDLILASSTRVYTPAEKLALATEKNEHYKELIALMTPGDLLPGAVQALDDCGTAGLKIGLASVSRNAFTVLDRLGITDKFDYVVDARTIARGKPDPEIFLAAATALGVAPAHCFGVEDAVAGVASIKSAGMYAVGVGDPHTLRQADVVIPSLAQFRLGDYLAA
ncbi:beta-phosphoglucomutase [Pseudoduganella plicata]|uniref:Beta-phosphoglucomutase n=1 Tax=Pseudoduganella plicata TaxID=321984 RepID=A0A4P7BJE3_9BURK|nr:beta-phosphoglucomutase [Pseudoduganella plicata]QBQ37785.1 beta-phosphoglucomutase [Pseudoduganella plicata]GGY93087.1 beta-phosphoglucomutase [Pseudoduganella plicata]